MKGKSMFFYNFLLDLRIHASRGKKKGFEKLIGDNGREKLVQITFKKLKNMTD